MLNDESVKNPEIIKCENNPILTIKTLFASSILSYGLCILSFNGNLYTLGENIIDKKSYEKPKLIFENVYDVFRYRNGICILDKNGNLKYHSNCGIENIWTQGNAKKIENDFVLTHDHDLYMLKDKLWSKILSNIKDFDTSREEITYLTLNGKLFHVRNYGNINEYKIIAKYVKEFSTNGDYGVCYVDINSTLYFTILQKIKSQLYQKTCISFN